MIFKSLAAPATAAAVLAMSSSALAQAPAVAPTAPGPVINGVCVINIEGAVASSTVGKYVNTRLQQLVAQVKAELTPEQTAIQNEGRTLQTQRASLDARTYQQRGEALQARFNTFQQKAELRDREIQATEQKAVGRIVQEMNPLIQQAYAQKNCGLLLRSNGVLAANPAMDITPQVVTALNAKITQFPFEREHLDQGEVAKVPGASTARPAAPTRK
jgi:outer membrane protein